jgi:hypothetical protein
LLVLSTTQEAAQRPLKAWSRHHVPDDASQRRRKIGRRPARHCLDLFEVSSIRAALQWLAAERGLMLAEETGEERRANYYLDVARGHSLAGHRDEAVSTLLTADKLFPDEIRCRPLAIDLIDNLRRSASGTQSRQLAQLAARAGLTNHG